VLEPKQYPRWQLDYLTLLTRRDLPIWGLPAKPQTTDRLFRMPAVLHGQVWNASQVGQNIRLLPIQQVTYPISFSKVYN